MNEYIKNDFVQLLIKIFEDILLSLIANLEKRTNYTYIKPRTSSLSPKCNCKEKFVPGLFSCKYKNIIILIIVKLYSI